MKTMEEWKVSKKDLTKFLNFGDKVGLSIYDYMLGVLPPAVNNSFALLMGEPMCHNSKGEEVFISLVKIDGSWIYAGGLTVKQGKDPDIAKIIKSLLN